MALANITNNILTDTGVNVSSLTPTSTTISTTAPLQGGGDLSANRTLSITQSGTSANGFLSSTDWNTFNNKQAAGNYMTSLTGEATGTGPGATAVTLNNASVTAKVLTGVNITGGTVQATDSILTAFGKLQNQINGLIGSSIYQGVWNAATNTPALASGVGVRGYYYIVNVAGTTNLDGITDWFVGDWAIFDGTAWQQVDNTDAVVSVNGQTGAVSLTTDNIPEGATNQYFLNSRARAALSFTAGSGAYNSTTGVITIPTNTSQLTNGANFITLASLSGTAPIVYSNTTGAISITQSGTASNGYLSSTDWNTFNNKQPAGSYVTLTGVETLSNKTFSNVVNLSVNGFILAGVTGVNPLQMYSTTLTSNFLFSSNSFGTNINNDLFYSKDSNNKSVLSFNNTAERTYTFPNASGTIALTSDIPVVTGYVPYTGATGNVNLGVYSITTGSTSTFSSAANLSAIFSNGGAAGNYNAIELRGGTAGTAPNWQISKDNTVANALQIFASTINGGTTYTTPLFTLVNTGYLTLANGLFAANEVRVANSGYLSTYNTSLRSIAGAIGVLQLGNNNDNYILVGNTAAGGYLSIRVNVSSESASSGVESLRLDTAGGATFYNNLTLSSASSVADLGGVLIVRGNGSAYTTHYLTTGAANVAAYYQYDAAGVAKTLIRAGDTSYFLGGNVGVNQATPLYTLDVNGTTRNSGANEIQFRWDRASAKSWGLAADVAGGYIKNITDTVIPIYWKNAGNVGLNNTDPLYTLDITGTLRATDVVRFSSRLNVNGTTDDADIALHTKAPAGAGKYIYVGRDSSDQWRFSVRSDGFTNIGSGTTAEAKLLTVQSAGNNLDTGAVIRIIGNVANDLVDISVSDTKTRIYHQENAADAANGYGIVQFRTNAVGNATYPTRGGFQFTIEAADVLFINSIGAATFASSVSAASFSTGGNISLTTTGAGYYVYGSLAAARYSYFGYSSGYNGVYIGSAGAQSLFFNVDITGNPSGAFSGNGSEYVWRNAGSFITPNSINNGYNTLLSWSSSGVVTIANLVATSLSLGSNIQIGDYTSSTSITFASSSNGISKLNFYDANSTEGLYLRTDGEQYGGTMTFGARWDDDEAKIVFKMYQVSAGGTYNARVGIGTGALTPLSMLHVCETAGGNYTGSFQIGGSSGFGIVADYTQSAYTTATMYVSPSYSSADVIFKLGAGSGNTNQLVLKGSGSIGINNSAPNASWGATISNPTLYSSNALRLERNGIATQGLNISAGGEVVTFNAFNTASDGLNSAFIWNSTAYNTTTEWMRILISGNLAIGVQSAPGRLTVKYSSYASGQTPLYVGNSGYAAWNRNAYDTFVLQQDDVTSFRMVEKNGEANTSDQILCFSIGDGSATIATSAQPLKFFVNGSPSGVTYQGLSGTEVLRLNTNGNAQFYGALTVSSTVESAGLVATSGGIAEVRLRGGGYGSSYNTSLRSIVGAPGVLQMGNNGPNYILAGNTAAGGLLYFRVNCATESVTAGSLALTLNSNATAQFESTVTASAFYESSDSRLKTLVKDDYKALGVESVKARLYIKDGKEEIGYYAQDLESILPSAVSKNDAGFLSLSYTQVHTAKIAIIEDEVDILKKEVAELKVKLQKYEA